MAIPHSILLEQRKLDNPSWIEPFLLKELPVCFEGLCEELD